MAARVVAVAHFPPPVHGMAVVVERVVGRLEEDAPVRRVSIAAPGLDRSAAYHLVRVARVLRALAVLGLERRRSRRAFFSCDAGTGMAYTLVLTAWARALGYHLHLQHHSYVYVERRSAVLALLVRAVGERCEHLLSCERMRADFAATYPRARTRVVGIAGGLGLEGASTRPVGPVLVLGSLGNQSLDKGLDLVVETARAVAASGLPVELRVAGPVVGDAAERLLTVAAAEPDVVVRRVGPVYGADRDAFLDDLDVFLFPSRYAHESFGLVAWEAMARGTPVVAYRAGCLHAAAVGDAGVVVERSDEFVPAAVAAIDRWWQDPACHARAAEAARATAATTADASRRDVDRFCDELAGLLPASAVPRRS